jgi:hypothetical protein
LNNGLGELSAVQRQERLKFDDHRNCRRGHNFGMATGKAERDCYSQEAKAATRCAVLQSKM